MALNKNRGRLKKGNLVFVFLFLIKQEEKGNNWFMSKKIVRNRTNNIAVYGSSFAVLFLGTVLFLVLGFLVKGAAGVAMFVFAGIVGVGTVVTLVLSVLFKNKIPADAKEIQATLISFEKVYLPKTQSFGYILTFQHDGGSVVYHSSVRFDNEKIVSQMQLWKDYPVLEHKHKIYVVSEKLEYLLVGQKPGKINVVSNYSGAFADEDEEDYVE